jgi:predicted aconitase with swiveling domain
LKTLKGRTIVPGKCQGKTLVATKPISFLGGIDPDTGKIVEKNHDRQGESIKGKILCFPHGHGSTVGSYVLYALAKKGFAPKAIINQTADPVVVVGAIIAGIPMIDKIDIRKIPNGEQAEVDADSGIVKLREEKTTCT